MYSTVNFKSKKEKTIKPEANKQFLIRKSPQEFLWLDGFDGDTWEWTSVKVSSWRLRFDECQKKLELINKRRILDGLPLALMVEIT